MSYKDIAPKAKPRAGYQRDLPSIPTDAAEAEPPTDRVFQIPEATVPDLPRVSNPAPPPRLYPARTYTIDAVDPDGFPVHFAFTDLTIEQFQEKKAAMVRLGYTPPTAAARHAIEEERKREAPICEYHGPMKESGKRPGTYFCPAKMGDGIYCKSKA